jgi:hypothetical protein
MTWVLGAAIPFGYGAIVSDVRVTWGDGRIHHDVLQKVYPVGSMMTAAFAGSVEIGFELIADMQRCFALGPGRSWFEPKVVAWRWRRRARRMFEQAEPARQRLGASLILVGMSREMNGAFRRARCIRMVSPTFEPEFVPELTWASIGTGTQHRNAAEYTRGFPARFRDFYALTEPVRPGEAARSVASTVSTDLEREPLSTVSSVLQVATVWRDEHKIENLRRERRGAWTVEQFVPPVAGELISSWADLVEFSNARGLEAAAAAT